MNSAHVTYQVELCKLLQRPRKDSNAANESCNVLHEKSDLLGLLIICVKNPPNANDHFY